MHHHSAVGARIERRTFSGRLQATVRIPGVRVWGLAAGGGAVWAIDRDTPALLRIAPRTNRITRFRLPGAPIELALKAGHPLSYICTRAGVSPADPAELAAQLLP